MSQLPIRPYERLAASFHPWDPRTVEVAREVAVLVASAWPGAVVEHVGSSSVPGLPGKNIIDLGVEIEPDDIPVFTQTLYSLGFGPQPGVAVFPATRPMVVGAVEQGDDLLRIHLHVMPPGRRELPEMMAFRDALRSDADLRAGYTAAKQAIVDSTAAGTDPGVYTLRKSNYVLDALYRLEIRRRPADAPEPLAPGATIGILGGGQLGRMLGFAARAMGYRIIVLDPDPACPAAAIADEVIVAPYDDAEAATRLAERSDVVTYELEHVGEAAAAAAAAVKPLRPGLGVLRTTRDRLVERRFLRSIGELTAPWREVRGVAATEAAAETLGYPLRLKQPIGGYDGRSQARIAARSEVAGAVAALGATDGRPMLLEREIDFEMELSVVVARDGQGRTLSFPVAQNTHHNGILVESVAPAPVNVLVANEASEVAGSIARRLDVVGVLTVELFRPRGGGTMVNELAPRVHNSGHWTIEGAATSQFEQHLRAILGLPLGSVAAHGTAAVVNVLGTGPDRPARLAGLQAALADPDVHVHVYDKRRVFERRKMGHVTVVAADGDDALERARAARAALHWED